jgi:hypothetical protein
MSTNKLRNVSLRDYREFLSKVGCNLSGTKGGHEKWIRKDLTRPIIVQTHKSPVPEFIIKSALRVLGLTKEDFFNVLFDIEDKRDNFKNVLDASEPVMNDEDLCYCQSDKKYKDCCKFRSILTPHSGRS